MLKGGVGAGSAAATVAESKEVKQLPPEEFFRLTDADRQRLEQFIRLRAKGPGAIQIAVKTFPVLTRQRSEMLIRLAANNEMMEEVCRDSALQEYWQQNWSKNWLQVKDHYVMQPQPLINYFDLYRGYYCFCLARSAADATPYLKQAEEYGSFHTLYKQLQETAPEKISELLIRLEKLAALHLTPGYVLLMQAHSALKNYEAALRNLLIAEKLIPYSTESIKNACLGVQTILDWDVLREKIVKDGGLTASKIAEIDKATSSYVAERTQKLPTPIQFNAEEQKGAALVSAPVSGGPG